MKFQVCTPQKNWSLSSPPSKMLLPRMDSPDHSTTTFPTVSIFINSTFSLSVCYSLLWSVHIYVAHVVVWSSSHCKSLLHVSFLSTDCGLYLTLFVCFPAVQWCVCCRSGSVSLRMRLLLENQINSCIIVKANQLKSLPLTFTIQLNICDTTTSACLHIAAHCLCFPLICCVSNNIL